LQLLSDVLHLSYTMTETKSNQFIPTFKYFKGDLFGGLTAGIVALPLALAFGVQSGLGATAGLYGAIFISFFAALFGGTNTQISGPTAPMTAVSMVVIAGIIQANDGELSIALPSILFVFFLSGLIQIGLGFIGVGVYIRYIPYPVVSGFMSGIGIIIIITQLLPLFGYYPADDLALVETFKPEAKEVILNKILNDEAAEDLLALEDFQQTIKRGGQITNVDIMKEAATLTKGSAAGVLGALKYTSRAIGSLNWLELLLALSTIIIIYGSKRITSAIPSTLVALVVVTAVAALIGWDYRSIGEIPIGFPGVQLEMFYGFKLADIQPYIFTAFALAMLGAIDSLLTSVVADNMTKTKHKPNRELIGQGIGNSIASVFGGIPGAGATIRTVVNINAGGKTKLSGMIAGLILLAILLVLGPVASIIPAAVLAGILFTVGVGVLDYKGLKHIAVVPKAEAFVMIVVLLLTVFVGLLEAVAIGMVLSALLFMKKISEVVEDKIVSAPLQEFSIEVPWIDEGNTTDILGQKVYIKHLDGPLFFGFASRFQEMARALPEVEYVIVRMDKVPYMDQSGLYAMEDVILSLQEKGINFAFTGLHGQPKDMMESIRILPDLISDDMNFDTFKDCMMWLEEKYDIDLDKDNKIGVGK